MVFKSIEKATSVFEFHFPKRLNTNAKKPVIKTPITNGVAGIHSKTVAIFIFPLLFRNIANKIRRLKMQGINQARIFPWAEKPSSLPRLKYMPDTESKIIRTLAMRPILNSKPEFICSHHLICIFNWTTLQNNKVFGTATQSLYMDFFLKKLKINLVLIKKFSIITFSFE